MKLKKKIPLIDQHDKMDFGEENLVETLYLKL